MRGTSNLTGADLLASLRKGNTEISGYLEGAESEHFEVYPAYIASATPKGPLTKETFETAHRTSDFQPESSPEARWNSARAAWRDGRRRISSGR